MLPDTYRAHWETTRSRSVAAVQLGEPAFRVRRWLAPPGVGLGEEVRSGWGDTPNQLRREPR